MNLSYFQVAEGTLFEASKKFLEQELRIPVTSVTAQPIDLSPLAQQVGKANLLHKAPFTAIDNTYFLGQVAEEVFQKKTEQSMGDALAKIKKHKDYQGMMLFAVDLKAVEKVPPSRTQLAMITRFFNQISYHVPVVVLFRYTKQQRPYLAIATTERQQYQQQWRQGEKIGKVALLKDIDLQQTHTGHLKILQALSLPVTVQTFSGLYEHWKQAFSVSLLNKKFYQEIANWYFWAVKEVAFPADAEPVENTRHAIGVIRLLTRIIFVWFLKEKGLVKQELFDKQLLDKHLKWIDKKESTYYKAILQNLFFATFNQIMDKEKRVFRNTKGRQHYGATNLYRYQKLFKDPKAALQLFADIPFLNGGLFECLDKIDEQNKMVRIDGFSDREDNVLQIPDFLFFAEKREVDHSKIFDNKKRSKEKVKGLFHLLNSYKFTIDENTPIEEEIALDPELLGKVFENLLASFNPETQTTARKQTGSFYTPREIVNYMVDESLIAYLLEKLAKQPTAFQEFGKNQTQLFGNSVKKGQIALLTTPTLNQKEQEKLSQQLHSLLDYHEDQNPFNEQQSSLLIKALHDCKILDPACGSGAFPVGVLQKMVFVLSKLDPENKQWRAVQRQKAMVETAEAFQEGNKKIRAERLLEINETFDNNASNYGRKLFLIQDCLYGVDIQPIAVQICKLRFFISLIVDQKIQSHKENLGIRALPNLETKFVAANSLLGIDKSTTLKHRDMGTLQGELAEVRQKYFAAKTPKTKRKYREKDKEIRQKMVKLLKETNLPDGAANQLATWDLYNQNKAADFFDAEWMFGISDGFDIVIGNPPYVQIQKMSGQPIQQQLAAQKFASFTKTGDLYCLFYEKGCQLLKPNGHLIYITSNKWMRANYGKKMRKFFVENTNPTLLIDFSKAKIFQSATVFTNILLFQKSRCKQSLAACKIKENFKPAIKPLSVYFQESKIILSNLSSETWKVADKLTISINDKINKVSKQLKDWSISINCGIKTGYNSAFHINKITKEKLISEDVRNERVIKPLLRGKDIKRYNYEFQNLYTITTFPTKKIQINNYPSLKGFLFPLKERLMPKPKNYKNIKWTGRKFGHYRWFETQDNMAYWKDFEKEKIIWIEISDKANYTYDVDKMYLTNSAYFMTGSDLKYILAILNAKATDFYFFQITNQIAGGRKRYTKQYVEQVPIPKISKTAQQPFIQKVNQILALKKAGKPTQSLEKEIDQLVYQLYDLTAAEIALIEKSL